MMEENICIEEIKPQKRSKDRYNLYSGGEYIGSLGAEAIVAYGIRAGIGMPLSKLREAVEKDNAAYAFDSAAAILAHGQRSRAELTRKLKDRGIDDTAIEAALCKLASYGYVDDKAYAAEYVRGVMEAGSLGRMAVAYKLKEKGIAADVAAEAIAAYTEEDEKQIAKRMLSKLARGGDMREQKKRISAALIRHGFAYDVIRSLFSEDED